MKDKKVVITLSDYDSNRWGELLLTGTRYAIEIRDGQWKYVNNLMSICSELFAQWESIMPSDLVSAAKKMLHSYYSKGNFGRDKSGNPIPNRSAIQTALSIWKILLKAEQVTMGVPTRKTTENVIEDFGVDKTG